MHPIVSGLLTLGSAMFNSASSGNTRSSGVRTPAESADAGPAAVLTLSKDAAAFARFADQGVSIASRPLEGSLGKTRAVTTPRTDGGAAWDARNAVVSKEDFQKLLADFGASDDEKATLTAGFDADHDGSITQAEFLKGLAKTQGSQSHTNFSQALMRLMDRPGNANGEVSSQEFAHFTTAFADAHARRAM